MAGLHLYFLGSTEVAQADGQQIQLRTRKELALLAYLAAEEKARPTRETLLGLFWPEQNMSDARNNLRVSLARLRKSLSDSVDDPLIATRQTVQLNRATIEAFDVRKFRAFLRMVESHTHDDLAGCQHCLQHMSEAVDLYRGEFLRGLILDDCDTFDEWLLITREQLHLQFLDAVVHLEEGYLALNNLKGAENAVRRRLAVDPLQEDAHRLLMQLMALNGQPHAALVQYETCRRILEEELDVPPAEETMALYQQIRDGQIQPAVAAKSGLVSHQMVAPSNAKHEEAQGPKPAQIESLLSQFDALPEQKLFGIEQVRTQLQASILAADRPWLLSIDGIGGIGKTTLARDLVRAVAQTERFAALGWVSAKQEEFLPESGIQPVDEDAVGNAAGGGAALDVDALTDALLEQVGGGAQTNGTAAEKRATLARLLEERPSLLVIDNLETVADYEALIPTLRQLANPSKFLITSRLSIKQHADVFCLSLSELSQESTLALLHHEAEVRGILPLADASDAILEQIYAVVGGHPLALNLVLGQLIYLPLSQVLNNLEQARGRHVDELYTYIYWQAWQMLDDSSRQLFLSMPLLYNSTFAQLAATSLLEFDKLQGALTQLLGLSLVLVGGDLVEPRYRLHRLTETFLMHEVLKWEGQIDLLNT